MRKTDQQYQEILGQCREIFIKKLGDYGSTWRVLRLESLTDQLFIKARRIRSLQQKKENKIGEGIEGEFIALFNYSIIAMIQLDLEVADLPDLSVKDALGLYDMKSKIVKDLMLAKNHDYGEAWREMRVSSMTDIILVKLFRIKQIEDNQGKTMISEGVESNFMDIANYAVFCLIILKESQKEINQ